MRVTIGNASAARASPAAQAVVAQGVGTGHRGWRTWARSLRENLMCRAIGRGLGAQERTWANERELCRRIVCYPLRT